MPNEIVIDKTSGITLGILITIVSGVVTLLSHFGTINNRLVALETSKQYGENSIKQSLFDIKKGQSDQSDRFELYLDALNDLRKEVKEKNAETLSKVNSIEKRLIKLEK